MLQHLKAIWSFRYFWMSLVRMDLRSRYRRSVLGIGWSAWHPVAMSGVFCLVFSQIFDIKGEEWAKHGYSAAWRGYAAFLLTGMCVWDYIRTSVVVGCHALIHNEVYIRQCPLPFGIYTLRTVMGTTIHFLISMTVVLVLVSLLRESFDVLGMLWAVLPAMVLLFLFCWALATLAAFATVYFHDTSHLVEVGSQLMFFLTPIMYTQDKLGTQLEFLVDLNPVVVFLDIVRTPLVYGEVAAADYYVKAVALTAAAVGLACGTIGWLHKKVIFQL